MIISTKHELVFVAIPKTGTRSVYACLQKHFDGFLLKEHLTCIPEVYHDFYKFTVVRNPYDRLVSVWWATTRRGQAGGPIDPKSPLQKWAPGGVMRRILGNDISFENFCEHLPELGSSTGTHCIHAKPQSEWLQPNKFHRIIPIETLNLTWKEMPFNDYGWELEHRNTTRSKDINNPISRKTTEHYLNAKTIQCINEFYAEDFKRLSLYEMRK